MKLSPNWHSESLASRPYDKLLVALYLPIYLNDSTVGLWVGALIEAPSVFGSAPYMKGAGIHLISTQV